MNLTQQQKTGLKTMVIVLIATLIIVYLFISIMFKVQLLSTPCELCVESQPYLTRCFQQEMYYDQLIPGGINVSGFEGDVFGT